MYVCMYVSESEQIDHTGGGARSFVNMTDANNSRRLLFSNLKIISTASVNLIQRFMGKNIDVLVNTCFGS